MGKIRNDRDEYVGEWNVKLISWNPAFSLAIIEFPDGHYLEKVHVSDESHTKLWVLLRDENGKLKDGMGPYENIWKVNLVKVEHGMGCGPNHCGLQIETIKWIGEPPSWDDIKEGIQEKKKSAWNKLRNLFGFTD